MGAYHPQIVHFAIALLIVGVLARAASLYGRPAFLGPMATTLLVLGTLAAAAATYSGDLAHGPVEAMPGLRPAVEDHEAWGVRARNLFFLVALIELLALALRKSARTRQVLMASTVVGVVGLFFLYEAAAHGGDIVYGHAGGVGMRGDASTERLLLAGLYQQSQADRRNGDPAAAAALIDLAAERFPEDVEVRLLRAESLLLDRQNAAAALDALRAITPPAESRPLRARHALLTADALVAAGQREGAIATLQQLVAAFPNARVQQRLDELRGGGTPAP